MKKVSYDPALIQEFASRLYSEAASITVTSIITSGFIGTLIGAGVGFVFGKFVGNPYQVMQAIQTGALLVGVIGAVSGYLRGKEKAFQLKLQAQVALCQAQIALNTAPPSTTLIDDQAPSEAKKEPEYAF